jgi:hypothetical protein
VANSRLYIVPEADWPEGSKRNVVKDAHGYDGDAQVIGQIPQVRTRSGISRRAIRS